MLSLRIFKFLGPAKVSAIQPKTTQIFLSLEGFNLPAIADSLETFNISTTLNTDSFEGKGQSSSNNVIIDGPKGSDSGTT